MGRNDKYMDMYRRFESALKKSGFTSVKAYEESITDDQFKQEQIRICRLIRNYIEHESADFVEASDNMIVFLENETVKLDEAETPVKKKMISVKYAIRDTDLIVVAADFMMKRRAAIVPIFDQTDYAVGAIGLSSIVKCVAEGSYTKAKKVSTIQVAHKFGFINESTPMKKVTPMLEGHNKIYLVLNDNKKVVGWIV